MGDADNAEGHARIQRVIERAFRGVHHCHGWAKRKPWGTGFRVTIMDGISTYDFDVLTRLVIAAHDECVRVDIGWSGRGYLTLHLNARERNTGSVITSHPTIEEAIKTFRGTE